MKVHVQFPTGLRVLPLTDFEELVRQERIDDQTLIRWEPATGDAFQPASSLSIYQGILNAPDVRLKRAWNRRSLPYLTALIVGLEFRIFFWTHLSPMEEKLVEKTGLLSPAVLERHEVWRMMSYALLHGSIDHIVMNMLFIAYAGVALENMFGAVNLFLILLWGIVGGASFSVFLRADGASIGASAGDFGLLGACVIFGWRYLEVIPTRARPAFGLTMLVFTLWPLLNTFGEKGVDYWAHLGGLLGGMLITGLLRPIALENSLVHNRWVQAIGGGGLVLWLAILGLLGPHLVSWVPLEEDGIQSQRPSAWELGWLGSGQSGWASPVGTGTLVLSTDHHSQITTLDEESQALIERIQSIDAQAQVLLNTTEAQQTHLKLQYQTEGELRTMEGYLWVRGHYSHSLLMEGSDTETVSFWLQKAYTQITLTDPKILSDALKGFRDNDWRSLQKLALARADMGEQKTALELIDKARLLNPQLRDLALDTLTILSDPPATQEIGRIQALVDAFPEDNKVWAAAIQALRRLGDPVGAQNLLTTALSKWPENKRLLKLALPEDAE